MIRSSEFKIHGLTVSDMQNNALRFVKVDRNSDTSAAYAVILAPKDLLLSQSYTLKARLQLRNENANSIRIRFESAGVISNAWVDFNNLDVPSKCDTGLSVWYVDKDTIIVDVHLADLGNDNVRFSLHVLGSTEAISASIVLEKLQYDLEICAVRRNNLFHSAAHAGRAIQLCRGIGLEIGALYKPLPLDACVIHLDRFSTKELKRSYANDKNVPNSQIRQVQVVWKNSYYPFFDDEAFDFVVNSHVLEHVCNPGRQIQEWLRIVKPGGVLYMIIPDKNFCFDRKRVTTSVEHLMQEFEDDIGEVTLDHYRDYMVNTSGEHGHIYDLSEEAINGAYIAQGSIHVHTFDPMSLKCFIDNLSARLNVEAIHYQFNRLNMHVALRK